MTARSALVRNPLTGRVHLSHSGTVVCPPGRTASAEPVVLAAFGTAGPDAGEAMRALDAGGVRPRDVCRQCFGPTFPDTYGEYWRQRR